MVCYLNFSRPLCWRHPLKHFMQPIREGDPEPKFNKFNKLISFLSCAHFFPFHLQCLVYLYFASVFLPYFYVWFPHTVLYWKGVMLFNKRFTRAPFFRMESKIRVISMTTAVPPDGRRLPSKTYRSVKIFAQYTVTFSVFYISL